MLLLEHSEIADNSSNCCSVILIVMFVFESFNNTLIPFESSIVVRSIFVIILLFSIMYREQYLYFYTSFIYYFGMSIIGCFDNINSEFPRYTS